MDRLLNALKRANFDFVLYAWDYSPDGDYGVISLADADDLLANNLHVESGLNGYVDYFTRDATAAPKTNIEAVLSQLCAYRLNSVQFEDDTGYIHYEWRVHLYGEI